MASTLSEFAVELEGQTRLEQQIRNARRRRVLRDGVIRRHPHAAREVFHQALFDTAYWLDESGRRNGETHEWLIFRCNNADCRYRLLVRVDVIPRLFDPETP